MLAAIQVTGFANDFAIIFVVMVFNPLGFRLYCIARNTLESRRLSVSSCPGRPGDLFHETGLDLDQTYGDNYRMHYTILC